MPLTLPLKRPVPPELIEAAALTDMNLLCPRPGAFTGLLRDQEGRRWEIFKYAESSPRVRDLIAFATDRSTGYTQMARTGRNVRSLRPRYALTMLWKQIGPMA